MKSFLKNVRILTAVFLILSLLFMGGLIWQQYRSQTELWSATGENRATLQAQYALAGTIWTRDAVALAQSREGMRQYAEDPVLAQATMQLVGDYTHHVGASLEAAYQDVLLGTRRNPIRQLLLDLTGAGIRGEDLNLSLDSRLTRTAFLGLGQARGAAVLLNYKTGEVLALASTPSAHPDQVISFENLPDSSLVNRALYGLYPPGSTFKMITAAARLRQQDFDPYEVVSCAMQPVLPNGAREVLGSGHGNVDLEAAFAASCNIYFGEQGLHLGNRALQQEAENWGWNRERQLDRLPVSSSVFACPDHQEALTSWAAIGQPVSELQMQITPLQLALQAALIANGGQEVTPHILRVQGSESGLSQWIPGLSSGQGRTVLSSELVQWEQHLMEHAVQTGLVQRLQIDGYVVGAKSGTAEVQGKDATGLIAAYLKDDRYPLAVAVVMEEIGSGAGWPLAIARNLLVQTLELYPDGLD